MKVRMGFVSNSSTSSFVVLGAIVKIDAIKSRMDSNTTLENKCPECGIIVHANDKFCAQCGGNLRLERNDIWYEIVEEFLKKRDCNDWITLSNSDCTKIKNDELLLGIEIATLSDDSFEENVFTLSELQEISKKVAKVLEVPETEVKFYTGTRRC